MVQPRFPTRTRLGSPERAATALRVTRFTSPRGKVAQKRRPGEVRNYRSAGPECSGREQQGRPSLIDVHGSAEPIRASGQNQPRHRGRSPRSGPAGSLQLPEHSSGGTDTARSAFLDDCGGRHDQGDWDKRSSTLQRFCACGWWGRGRRPCRRSERRSSVGRRTQRKLSR
jgi:hypothetical protein